MDIPGYKSNNKNNTLAITCLIYLKRYKLFKKL